MGGAIAHGALLGFIHLGAAERSAPLITPRECNTLVVIARGDMALPAAGPRFALLERDGNGFPF